MSDHQAPKIGQACSEPIRTGLIGRDILASRSPWLHQNEARANALALSYELFDFTQRGWSDAELGARLRALRDAGFAGVNITHPFKQQVLAVLDDLAPSARDLGAVNTVHFHADGMTGHNTDVTGFAESVKLGLAGARLDRVIQYGAGGAGSATAHALLSLGVSDLALVDTSAARAEALIARLAEAYPEARVAMANPDAAAFAQADGVVNATPIGMDAHPGTAFDPDWLDARQWVADIVYFPLETALLKAARDKGCQTLNGKGMVVFQAARAFDIFTGVDANRLRMLASFEDFVPSVAA